MRQELIERLRFTLNEIDKNADESSAIINQFDKALALTRPTEKEANSVVSHFSQAMLSGTLHNEEFISIVENARGVAQAIANGLGVSFGELRMMVAENKLTSDVVINALLNRNQDGENNIPKPKSIMEYTIAELLEFNPLPEPEVSVIPRRDHTIEIIFFGLVSGYRQAYSRIFNTDYPETHMFTLRKTETDLGFVIGNIRHEVID